MVALKHYSWLVVLSVLAIWSSTKIAFWPESIQDILVFLPYISVVLGMFIALWLNRIQPVLILLSLGCFNFILLYFSSSGLGLTEGTIFSVLSVLLPLNILLWILLPEKGVSNKRLNALVVLVFLVQAALLYYFLEGVPEEWLMLLSMPVVNDSNVVLLTFSAGIMFLLALFFIMLKMKQSSFKNLYNAVFVVLILMLVGVSQGS